MADLVLAQLLSRDPVLLYSLLATLFLALVSLASGLVRLDVLALGRPGVLLRVAVAVALGALITVLAQPLGEGWPLGGLGRLPLYVTALAYGPAAGLVSAALFAAFESQGGLPDASQGVLALELLLLGWLAIYPSPRQHRWAGPVDVVLAFALAWATAGVALLQWQTGEVALAPLWAAASTTAGGALLSAALLLLFGPATYRLLFPRSPIAPDEPPLIEAEREDVVMRPLLGEVTRVRPDLTDPGLPRRLRGRRGERRLDPPPPFDD